MTEGKPHRLWPGDDERSVVEAMIRDRDSKHWEECNRLVRQRVPIQAKNIPSNRHEEIIQEAMYKVVKYLPEFRFQSTLRTWLNAIIVSCIIDMYRKRRREMQIILWGDLLDDDGHESVTLSTGIARLIGQANAAEDDFFIEEDFRRAVELLIEYVNTHAKPERNKQILWMVLFEKRTHEETAKVVGCKPPVVGYVVREAQRYVRERMKHEQP